MKLLVVYVSQTLIIFELYVNNIGALGAQHLANALRQNKVTLFHDFVYRIINYSFSQSLATLDLIGNELGDQGALHLGNALLENKVTSISMLYFQLNYRFVAFYRHSQR